MLYEQNPAAAPGSANPYDSSVGYYAAQRYRSEIQNRAMTSLLRMDTRAQSWMPGLFGGRSQLYGSMMVNSPLASPYTGGSITRMGSGFIEAFSQAPGMVTHPRQAAMLGTQMTHAVQESMFAGGRALTGFGADRDQIGQAAALFGAAGGMNRFANSTFTIHARNSKELAAQAGGHGKLGSYLGKELVEVQKQMDDAAKKGLVGTEYSGTFMNKDTTDKAVKVFSKFAKSLEAASKVLQSKDYGKSMQLLNTLAAGNVAVDGAAMSTASNVVRKYAALGSSGYDTRELIATHLRTQNYLEQATGSKGLAAELTPFLAGHTEVSMDNYGSKLAQRGAGLLQGSTPEAQRKMLAAGIGDQLRQSRYTSTIGVWREQHATKAGVQAYNKYKKDMAAAGTTQEMDELTMRFADLTQDDTYSTNGVGVHQTERIAGSGAAALSRIGSRSTMKDTANILKERARAEMFQNFDNYMPQIMSQGKTFDAKTRNALKSMLYKHTANTFGTMMTSTDIGKFSKADQANIQQLRDNIDLGGINTLLNKIQTDTRYDLSSQSDEARNMDVDRDITAWKATATKGLRRARSIGSSAFLSGVFHSGGASNSAVESAVLTKYRETQAAKEKADAVYDPISDTYDIADGSKLNRLKLRGTVDARTYNVATERGARKYKEERENIISSLDYTPWKDYKERPGAMSKNEYLEMQKEYPSLRTLLAGTPEERAAAEKQITASMNLNTIDTYRAIDASHLKIRTKGNADLLQNENGTFKVLSGRLKQYGFNSGSEVSKEEFLKLNNEVSNKGGTLLATGMQKDGKGGSAAAFSLVTEKERAEAKAWAKKKATEEFSKVKLLNMTDLTGPGKDNYDNLKTKFDKKLLSSANVRNAIHNINEARQFGVDIEKQSATTKEGLENYKAAIEDRLADGNGDKNDKKQLVQINKLLDAIVNKQETEAQGDSVLGVLRQIKTIMVEHAY